MPDPIRPPPITVTSFIACRAALVLNNLLVIPCANAMLGSKIDQEAKQ